MGLGNDGLCFLSGKIMEGLEFLWVKFATEDGLER